MQITNEEMEILNRASEILSKYSSQGNTTRDDFEHFENMVISIIDACGADILETEKSDDIFQGKPIEFYDYGIVIYNPVHGRVFIPKTQLGLEDDLPTSFLDDRIILYVLQDRFVHANNTRLIGSCRKVAKKRASQIENTDMAHIYVGQVFTGVVKWVGEYGAFIDIGGLDGLVHNSRFINLSQIVVGMYIQVKINTIDYQTNRIGLSEIGQ